MVDKVLVNFLATRSEIERLAKMAGRSGRTRTEILRGFLRTLPDEDDYKRGIEHDENLRRLAAQREGRTDGL